MLQDILINWAPHETRVAVLEDGAVQELHIERECERGHVGNIYLGRVARVLAGMQSAFIDIGLARAAFLHVSDLWQPPQPAAARSARAALPLRPIEKQVFEGQTLLVQVVKDAIGTKGARLATQISVAGRLLVFLPQEGGHIGVSRKIDATQREALRRRLAALLQSAGQESGAAAGSSGGFIIRTSAEGASDAELAADIAYLRRQWTCIAQGAQQKSAPRLLHEELSLPQRVLRDLVGEHTQAILVDSRQQYEKLRDFARYFMPDALDRLRHYEGARPIFDLGNVDIETTRALGRRVELKSGGYLVIDQTEALTTVDVNTGAFVGGRNFEHTVLRANLEAARAIARQLRLRNIGGIVIIDFIDMQTDAHRQAVLEELRRCLAHDHVRTQVGGFSALGLVEMTRKRTSESLAQRLCQPCPHCQGSGRIRTPRTVAYDILREVLREARRFRPQAFRVGAGSAVIDLLRGEEGARLAALQEFIGLPIELHIDDALAPEGYSIALM